MRASYPKVLETITLPWEGGKVNNAKDPGGRTNQGVTQKTYDSWRSHRTLSQRSVYDMTDQERNEIYRTYWTAIQGDILPVGVDGAVFDAGVMSGPARGIKFLQAALAKLGEYAGKVDGFMGAQTKGAVQATRWATVKADGVGLVKAVCAQRLGFVQSLVTLFTTFGKGWTNRIVSVEATCVAMVLTYFAAQPDLITKPDTVGQALGQEAEKASKQADKEKVKTGGAVVAGGGGTTVDTQVPAQPQDLGGLDPAVVHIVIVVFVLGAVIAAAVYGWRWYVNRQRAEAYDVKAAQHIIEGT